MVEYWLVSPDGSNLRSVIPSGSWATWSSDGRWIYYADSTTVDDSTRNAVLKVPVEGGTPTPVRTDDAISPAIAPDGSALYYVKPRRNVNGLLDYELRVVRPETGPSKVLTFISGDRIPHWQGLHPVISQ